MNERDETQQSAPPYVIVENHEGTMLLTVPARGINREFIKSMVYGVVSSDGRQLWHTLGDFMDACEVMATLVENNPGMLQVIHGLLEARAHSRARRAAQQEQSL